MRFHHLQFQPILVIKSRFLRLATLFENNSFQKSNFLNNNYRRLNLITLKVKQTLIPVDIMHGSAETTMLLREI